MILGLGAFSGLGFSDFGFQSINLERGKEKDSVLLFEGLFLKCVSTTSLVRSKMVRRCKDLTKYEPSDEKQNVLLEEVLL